MKRNIVAALVVVAVVVVTLGGCLPDFRGGTQIILAGESFTSGSEALQEANNLIKNAAACGCRAISVGGYGAAYEGHVIGVPVLLDCPAGTALSPDGTCP